MKNATRPHQPRLGWAKPTSRPAFAALVLALLAMLLPAGLRAQSAETVPGQILVQPLPGRGIDGIAAHINARIPDAQAAVERHLSEPLRVWLIRFNPQVPVRDAIAAAHSHPNAGIVQANHVIRHRATTPNDPSFGQQWQYINTGQGGGTVDADIDAELAWDHTTGGLTPLGDTIVACIIDDGLALNHPDFGPNRWYNHQEIPNNNTDDDNNGYVDDYRGWDADNNNDNIQGGAHGTSVTGIVGAHGNNGIGVTGVNWNVKLMIVEGGGNEAQAVAAYSYPLTMRKLWNSTSGAKGAYVVVTNASWGTDFGQPSQAPLWCAIYDSLGKYGVLSCGATANGNINVDTQGDLPTACPSDYLISVTNMNRNDVKVTQAGYGVNTIDLGAHGEGTYTTDFGGGYGGFGGTSGATPHVTGTVALLYSAPCPNLAMLATADPDSAARLVKQCILDGTDPNASIANNTLTGGRLNMNGAITQLLAWACTPGGCPNAYGLATAAVTDTAATLQWSAFGTPDSFWVQLRALPDTNWTTVSTLNPSLVIDTLRACAAYEFRVAVQCDSTVSGYSAIQTFTTDGCCTSPGGYQVSAITPSSATIQFNPVLAAQSYTLLYAPAGTTNWTSLPGLTSTSTQITGLDSCTAYDFVVQTVCDTGAAPLGAIQTFSTNGCTGCRQTYCTLSGSDASEEWIAEVKISGIFTNGSGSDNGYGDYTGLSNVPLLQTGYAYNLRLTPGFSGSSFPEYFLVYIDYNRDGDFSDPGETAFDAGNASTSAVNGSFTVPSPAQVSYGISRMRVVMRYNTSNPACGAPFTYGEVEDYCVELAFGPVSNATPAEEKLSVWPNPFTESIQVRFPVWGNEPGALYIVSALGTTVAELPVEGLSPGMHQRTLPTAALPAGMYFLRYRQGGHEQSVKIHHIK